jgi:hypothetical protein
VTEAWPNFIPAQFVEWAGGHRELIETIVQALQRTGEWPLTSALTRESVRRGRAQQVEEIVFHMPQPLGFRSPSPQRAVLSLFGLRLSESGAPLLAGFYETLALARGRFEAEDAPALTSQDVGKLAVVSKAHPSALIEIVEREAPFLGNTTPESSSATPESSSAVWVREVSTAVVRYWDATTIDDYLRIRAEELRQSRTSHWPATELAAGEAADAEPPGDQRLRVFISHASEDKEEVARPIAEGLAASGWAVWLDEYELTVGDSLYQSIDHGLATSRCGVVVLSRSFFAKHWPKQELDALAAKETASGTKVILPVWHGIDQKYLAREAPMLANRLGVSTHRGIRHVVEQLTRALDKELGSDRGSSEPVFRSARAADSPSTAVVDEPQAVVNVPPLEPGDLPTPVDHRILWETQEVSPGGVITVKVSGFGIRSGHLDDWLQLFNALKWEPISGVGYHGVMMPEAWGWRQVELRGDGEIRAIVDPDRVESFAAHMNALVERTNRECEARQEEKRRAAKEERESQARDAARDEDLRQRLRQATRGK